jgi:hypothetical protein
MAGEGLTMPPGQTISLILRFLNPYRVPITCSFSVMRFSAIP